MTLTPEPDLGTPRGHGPGVTLTIDGRTVTVPAGTSVMRAAEEAGIAVPKLCATDTLEAFGSCRVCLVEVDGVATTPASCTTPVREGMVVRTGSPRIDALRRGVMELYLSDHPVDPAECGERGCELHAVAERVGLTHMRYGAGGATHVHESTDQSNPYFEYRPAECIVCSRCVRACEDIQGTFALTVEGRGFGSRVVPGGAPDLFGSACVSCGACVQACPTGALVEKAVVAHGMPDRHVDTTCAYCGVGCSFRAELRGETLVRMVPSKAGGANEGHSCVKGRFAFGYADHRDRQLHPMVRDTITDPWRVVDWDEALDTVARRFLALQAAHGVGAIGGITSSRTTNEEVYAVQKMIRGAFGNNNVDTCARVCHSPTGYGLSQTFGTSAGTQTFASVDDADVIMVIGANPTDAHPVFASRLKRRVRAGARLIVVDPRRIDLVRTPHVQADLHLQLAPGTNVAVINAMAHTVVDEGLADEDFLRDRCEGMDEYMAFIMRPENSPEAVEAQSGVPAGQLREAARMFAAGPNSAIYYGLGVTEHSQGSTMVMGMANLAMLTGSVGRSGVGVNPLRGQNNVQGSCDMGSFPHELPGYRHIADPEVRGVYERLWGRALDPHPGLRIPNMLDAAVGGDFRGIYIQGEDIAQSDPNTRHVTAALENMDCVVVHDLFLNETARYAHVFLPATSFLEKNGTFTNAERRINRVRPVMPPRCGMHEWQVVCEIARRMRFPMAWDDAAQIMDEIAATTPTFAGVSHAKLDALGSVQWPCNDAAPGGTPIMHVDAFVRGRGRLMHTAYVPTLERSTRRFPLILTTGRILSQYNVGAQTRRTANSRWHPEDVLEIHPSDAEARGVADGQLVELASRVGATHLRARLSERMPPGVVYTTFHHPDSGANVVTTENSDWATNCPEYKVTAVQVSPAAYREAQGVGA
ncbi:MAG: formate dehydrogenase subunit alpha [Thermoleophilia bacterium]